MPYEQMPKTEVFYERPTEEDIKDRALATIKDAEDSRGPRGERINLEKVILDLRAVIADKRGEAGADKEGIASHYKGYEAEDLEELVSLLDERLVQLDADVEADTEPRP